MRSHFLLGLIKALSRVHAPLCPAACDPRDCSLSGSSVQGIFQARILDFSRDLTDPSISSTNRWILCHWVTREALWPYIHIYIYLQLWLRAFSGGSDCKESACNAGDLGLIPGLGKSAGEGKGYPLQYSCLENSMDRGALCATVHGVANNWTQLSN